MRSRRLWVGILLIGNVAAAVGAEAPPGTDSAADAVAPLVAHRLVTLAYNRSRSAALPASLAAREAAVFLRAANREEPRNIHTLKLLVEAAAATGDAAVEREALRNLIRGDPGDLVAQVRYIDFLASSAETIDERAKIFEGAMNAATLDRQIRSEMAVRLANITRERGDPAGARALIQQALQFNDVNVGALAANVRLAEKPADHLAALAAFLSANPLEPDAWIEMSRVIAGAGDFDRAADYLNTGLEQDQLAGGRASAELYLELALDLATAGRRVEAYPILTELAKLRDAPISAPIAAQLLANEYTPKAPSAATTSAPATEPRDLAATIFKKLSAQVKADPKSPSVLADAIWVEYSVMPQPAAEAGTWLATLGGLVEPDDPVLSRLEGWRLLRAGKLDAARAILEKAAPGDPLAQLGLARVLLAQNKKAEALHQLEDLWWSHPSGIVALQVAQTARGAAVELTETIAAKQLLTALQGLPASAASAHREPRDIYLATATFPDRRFELDDPIMLRIRINNTTAGAVPVGLDGLIKTTIALSGIARGVDAKNLGVYAIEDLQRVYRLEPRSAIEASVRADQGAVAEYLSANPRETATVSVDVITAPRGSIENATPGLSGQNIPAGEFVRAGVGMGSGDDIQKLVGTIASAAGKQQAVQAELLSLAVEFLSDEEVRRTTQVDEAPEALMARTTMRAKVTKALAPLLHSRSAAMRVWMLLNLPMDGLNELQAAIMAMSADADPVVRIVWAERMMLTVEAGGTGADGALDALRKGGDAEKEPLVREAVKAMLLDVQLAAEASKKANGN